MKTVSSKFLKLRAGQQLNHEHRVISEDLSREARAQLSERGGRTAVTTLLVEEEKAWK